MSKIMDGAISILSTLQELLRSLFGNLALSYSAKWHQPAMSYGIVLKDTP